MSEIRFNEYGEIIANLDKKATQELKETGYCQVEDNYYVIETSDDKYAVVRTADFIEINLNVEEN